MAKKPANLVYGVDDQPPLGITLLQGLQHVFIMTVYFIFPVIVIHASGGTNEQAATMIKMSMIGMGVATILQCLRQGPIGSGYLGPSGNGPAYLPATLLAANSGGLSLICGMTIMAGGFEALFSRIVGRLRVLFPPEVAGLVVTMVGIELIPLGVERFLGLGQGAGAGINRNDFLVALITYVCMVGFNTWGEGKLRLYPILIGMGVGYLSSLGFGVLTPAKLVQIGATPWISFPRFASFGWSFNMTLILPFLIASLCSSLKDIGDLTTCQKINDSDWKRSDMRSIGRGILAEAIGSILSGVIGGLGQTTSSSNIGLSLATGSTSRRIAYATGGLLIFLAFFPKLAEIFVIMPPPVMGAILVFAANFMILAGIQIITTRMLDARKIFVIGTSFIFGLSVFLYPQAYRDIPPLLEPIFSSALSLATICVVVLNLIFRLGIAKHQKLTVNPEDREALKNISVFIRRQGAAWGARWEVIKQAESAMQEFMESLIGLKLAEGPIEVEVKFDEMSLDARFAYQGQLLDFQCQPPSQEDLLEDDTAIFRLSGFIIKNSVDRIKTETKNGQCRVVFHFDH